MNAGEFVVEGRCKCCGHKLAVWTPQRIVDALHAWSQAHGRVPTATDWAAGTADHPAQPTVCTMFGSWNNALNAAELTMRARMERRPVWTRDMVVAAMLDHVVTEGSWPTWREWAKAKPAGRTSLARPSAWTVRLMFGSWRAAIAFASGATDPDVATEYRALSSARRLAAVEPLPKTVPAAEAFAASTRGGEADAPAAEGRAAA